MQSRGEVGDEAIAEVLGRGVVEGRPAHRRARNIWQEAVEADVVWVSQLGTADGRAIFPWYLLSGRGWTATINRRVATEREFRTIGVGGTGTDFLPTPLRNGRMEE